jgi:transcriptional regulator with XRE-family HTH domain
MHNKIDYPVIGYVINNRTAGASNSSNPNFGRIVERVVRRDRMGISELARRLKVSRRTIYNWFEMERLSIDIISKIGFVIGHDFSDEFPEEFANADNHMVGDSVAQIQAEQPNNAIYYWMDRYIKLLEKFNEVLSHEIKDHDNPVQ